MTTPPPRVGIIGFGKTGRFLYEQLSAAGAGDSDAAVPQLSFIYNRTPTALAAIPERLRLLELADLGQRIVDTDTSLVVEVSHPDITLHHGSAILAQCSYMPMSLTALADARLLDQLLKTAASSGTTLHVSHGAVTALDSLHECRDLWESVTVTMTKPPVSLDFTVSGLVPPTGSAPATLYDGPTRGLCPLFPRNTNVHAAVALAGIGFDRTRSILIADPTTTESRLDVSAIGPGVSLHVSRTNELEGVSGIMTLRAALGSLRTSTRCTGPLVFC